MSVELPAPEDERVQLAHEMRTPLAVLSSAAQLLAEHPLPPEMQRECLATIDRQVQRMADILDRMIDFEGD